MMKKNSRGSRKKTQKEKATNRPKMAVEKEKRNKLKKKKKLKTKK